MNEASEQKYDQRRAIMRLRWTQRVLLAVGCIAVIYTAFTYLYAQVYQQAAGDALDKQIRINDQFHGSRPRTVAKEGDVLGRIQIPRLGIAVAILEGTTSHTLRLGAGHIEGTPFPGEPGNSGIAGHRDTYFRRLKQIRSGDEIRLQTSDGIIYYQVDWVQIVAPRDTDILSSSVRTEITLVTCYPFHFIGSAPERFAVHAHQM
jgi:sortase A